MSPDMCTKPCPVPIISWVTEWMTGFRFYPTSDTEHYQLVILHEFVVNEKNYRECIMLSRVTKKILLCGIALSVLRLEYLRFPK